MCRCETSLAFPGSSPLPLPCRMSIPDTDSRSAGWRRSTLNRGRGRRRVGFDINCGVRLLATPVARADLDPLLTKLADDLYRTVPAGLGSEGKLRLSVKEIDRLLQEGARYVVERGYGLERDLTFIEEEGRIRNADPLTVSLLAKQRQFRQVGTLGSGNHYLEVQTIERVFDQEAAAIYGLTEGQVVVSIHTGSRALGHQIGQDYLKEMERASKRYQIPIRERELVCAPIKSLRGSVT